MNTELKQEIFDSLKTGINAWTGQQMNNLGISIPEGGGTSNLVDTFLQTNFDDEGDSKMKKIIAATQLVGHVTGVAPINNISPVGLAAFADQTIESTKTIFKVATNQITIEEASDRMIDVATTRLMASVDTIIDRGIDFVSTKLVSVISAAYPPAAPVAMAVSALLQKAKPTIKTVVKNAIPHIKEKVKVVSRHLLEAGRKWISKLFA